MTDTIDASAPPAGGAPAPSPSPAAPAPAPASAPSTIAGGATPAPAPAAREAAPAPSTIAGGATPPDTRLQVATTWPEDWRERLAGDDKAFAERLKRFNDPTAIARSYRELETRVSSGQLKAPPAPLAENATPEQVTAWRAEQGLPATAEAIMTGLALPDGVIPGEADRPLLANFAEAAYNAGWTQDQYNTAVGWYYSLQDQLVGERQQADADFHTESMVNLQSEWGRDYQKNQNILKGFWDRFFPKDVGEAWLTSRMPDGTIVGDNPGFAKAMLEIAAAINPVGVVLPNVPGATMNDIHKEYGELQVAMKAVNPGMPGYEKYWGNPAAQARFRELASLIENERDRATPPAGMRWDSRPSGATGPSWQR